MDGQEALFWKAIEAAPADATVRLAFTDWLGDQNDPREAGMRALAAQGKHALDLDLIYPELPPRRERFTYGTLEDAIYTRTEIIYSLLPDDWFRAMLQPDSVPRTSEWWKYFETRAEAESAACLAFAELSADEQAQLLSGVREAVVK